LLPFQAWYTRRGGASTSMIRRLESENRAFPCILPSIAPARTDSRKLRRSRKHRHFTNNPEIVSAASERSLGGSGANPNGTPPTRQEETGEQAALARGSRTEMGRAQIIRVGERWRLRIGCGEKIGGAMRHLRIPSNQERSRRRIVE
jgi:hypothetical protein